MKQANKELEGIMQNFANRFEANQIKLEVTPMTGLERLSLFSYFCAMDNIWHKLSRYCRIRANV